MRAAVYCSVVVICLTGFLFTPALEAQTNTGVIVGTVSDPTGAVIPGATVTITQSEMQIATVLDTNAVGNYVSTLLRAGPYEIRVEAPGFQTALRRGIVLHVNDRLQLNFTLQPGAIAEVIEVTGGAPLLETQTGDVSSVIDSRAIVDLPLDGRSYIDLMLLAPGVLQAPNLGSNPREGRFTVNGNSSLQNYFVLNGVDNNSFTQNAQDRSPQVGRPAPDALREFKIQTRTYTAEFGWAVGAVINTEVKGGSNGLHGRGWWFHRNDNLNATSFFLNRAGQEQGEQRRNQWGFAVGGPIVRDKTFWFFDYENTDASEGQSVGVAQVPSALYRQGNFSEQPIPFSAADFANFLVQIPEEAPCLNVDTTNNLLLGLNLTAMRLDGRPCGDPVGLALVELYPLPTGPGLFDFSASPPKPTRQNRFDLRFDHQLTAKDNVYGVYDFFDVETIVEQGALPNPLATGGFTGFSNVRTHVLSLAWVHTFSPTVVNDARFGANRVFSTTDPVAPAGDACPDFGLLNCPGTFAFGLPPIRPVTGFAALGTFPWRPQNSRSQVWQVIDNLSYMRGQHSFKFGFEWKRAINNFLDIRAPNGEMEIRDDWTNSGMANLLLGNMRRARITSPLVPHNYTDGTMFYAQDSWRVTPTFTFNYGVRYEYFTPIIERDRLVSNFDPDANGGRGALVTAFPGTLPTSTSCGFPCFLAGPSGDSIFARTLIHPDRNNIAPRLSAAWQIKDKIVLRGGYAIFYQAAERAGSGAILQLNPPQFFETVLTASNTTPPQFFLRDGFPLSAIPPTDIDPTSLGLRAQDMDQKTPWSQQWSFGPQIELGGNMALEIVYVGQDGNDLRKWRNFNQGVITNRVAAASPTQPATATITFPFPDFGSFGNFQANDGRSSYHSLQATLRKRFSRGLMFNAAYTYGKAMGDTGDNLTGGAQIVAQDANNLAADYGLLQSDQTQRLVVSWVWEVPFGPGQPYLNSGPLAKILGDWQITGITSHSTGVPLTVSASDRSGTGDGQTRADCIGSVSIGSRSVDSYGPLFSGSPAFAQPADFTFGNCGVGTLRSWPHHNWDMGLFKKARIDEDRWLEFRVEFFNLFNTPQFASPNTSCRGSGALDDPSTRLCTTNSNFGRTGSVLDSSKPARVIQLGLKFIF